MAKKKPDVYIQSYGLYDGWDRESKDLPSVVKITTEIEAALDVEFGYILHIRGARNSRLRFCIDHPPFKDSSGNITPPFEDELYIKKNDYRFFLGDTVWEPVDDKRGEWRLTTWIDDALVADKILTLV